MERERDRERPLIPKEFSYFFDKLRFFPRCYILVVAKLVEHILEKADHVGIKRHRNKSPAVELHLKLLIH